MEYEGGSGTIERPEDIEKNPAGIVRRWLLEIGMADKREDKWRKKAAEINKRYRQENAKKHSYNILWSNTETLKPAVYNSLPKPDVRRRFKDADPIGKAVSEVLYRAIEYGLDTSDFDQNVKSCVLDLLLPGRGVARVRYVPSFSQVGVTEETHYEENEQHAEPGGEALEGEIDEELEWETCPIEHVQWEDFRILCAAKEWGEVTAIGYRHRMTRDQLCEKFGDEIGDAVQLDATDDEEVKQVTDERIKNAFKTAEVWEIWCKESKKVYFISRGLKEQPLLSIDDPLSLIGFFPSPRPMYAIEDSSSLVPIPLYEMYKEQADELDTITKRINIITKGLKLRGVYDSTLTELSELMRGEDNDLIPLANAAAFLERGGLEKAIWFLPIKDAAAVLQILFQQREGAKQVIYEITGISDILRGATNANETATAQQIKSKWGSLRVNNLKGEVARFVRDLIRIQAEIIGEKFQPETLVTMTGLKLPTMQEKQQMAMQAQQTGQQMQDLGPSWEEVIQVLRDDKMRTFKVDVETDSTVAASIETDMTALKEVLTAVVQLVQGFGPAVQMGAMPVEAVKELILAVTRRAQLGNAVEDALDKIQKPQQQPQQGQQQQQDNSLQVEQIKQQAAAQIKQVELQAEGQIEQMRQAAETQREAQRIEFDRWKVQIEAETKILVAQIAARSKIDAAESSEMNSFMNRSETEEGDGNAGSTLSAAQVSAD